MKSIYEVDTTSTGEVKLLELDLGDLESVKKAAETFKRQESKLDVLWNNAGISHVPVGSKARRAMNVRVPMPQAEDSAYHSWHFS